MVDREHDKFWGKKMNEDAKKFRQQSELKKMENRAYQKNHIELHNQGQAEMKKHVR